MELGAEQETRTIEVEQEEDGRDHVGDKRDEEVDDALSEKKVPE